MFIGKAKLLVLVAGLSLIALIATACTSPHKDPPVQLRSTAPAALVIATGQPHADLLAITALVTGAVCPREHLEIVVPNFNAGSALYVSRAPATSVMPGPVPPKKSGPGPTQYQRKIYTRALGQYDAKLRADRHQLEQEFSAHFRAWAATVITAVAGAPATSTGPRLAAALSDGSAYFASLNQSGVHLGQHKVTVIFTTGTIPGRVPLLRTGSVHGGTVIIVNFKAGQIRRAAWRYALLRAGATSVHILAPAAIGELPGIVRQALGGCNY